MFEEREPPWTGSALQLVGREVRASRHRLGWTQRDLGRRVRLSQSTISRVEHGRNRTLKLSRFVRLVVVLGWVGTPEARRIALVARDPQPWEYREGLDATWSPLDIAEARRASPRA
ncbi:MAG TPA: helix-turn-helix transcriptional regulator [Candidatus Limnocylindrales bacterium]|nr:helix-turn-helix transcriptional regulator [Candidatus Limnocylindrales bacterium]